MNGKALMSDFSLLVIKTEGDIERELSAAQLCAILAEAETMILNQAHVAPCVHAGSRYQKEGEEAQRCGVCSRQVEEEFKESLHDA